MAEPSSLAGPLARIDRADALIKELDTVAAEFCATKPYQALPLDDPNPQNRRYQIASVEDVPLPIRVRAGEIVHHTRAALDLLVYQLMVRAGETDDKRLRKCAFPIVTNLDAADAKQMEEYRRVLGKAIDGVPPKARERIEALQPWRPENGGEWSHLAQVQELDNTQKHRLLLTGVVAFRMKNFVINDNGVMALVPEAFFPIGPGNMVIANGVEPGAPFEHRFADAVIFHESGPPSGWPLGHILQNLNNITRGTVEQFADCF